MTFDYAWLYGGGGPVIATGAHWRADAIRIDYGVVCQVTAHDAQGATTSALSPQVVIQPGISTVRITKVTVHHGSLTVSGVAGPGPALARTSVYKPYLVLDRRLNKTTLLQLAGPKTLTSRNGHFTIGAQDAAGRHTYVIEFVPAPASSFSETSTSRKVTIPR